MPSRSRLPAPGAWLPLAVLTAVACQQGPTPEQRAQLARLDTVSAERDQLMQEVSQDARTISEIAVELSKVRVPERQLRVSSESPIGAQRDTMIQKVRYIAGRIAESERKLNDSQRRIRSLTTLSDSLRATLDSTITNFQTVVATQRATIDSLVGQVTQLATENGALKDTVSSMSTRENTVYYVVGTKEELLQRGIVVEEGGSRVLFILWKAGKTLTPARELHPTDFVAINKREVTEIPLPDAAGQYVIASRQDPGYLATPPDEKGRITGVDHLRITAPEQFWTNSKFLVVGRTSGLAGPGGAGPPASPH